MLIDYLPAEFLINGARKNELEKTMVSDFVLRAIRLVNNSENAVYITRCAFELKTGGKTLHTAVYTGESLESRLESLVIFADRFLKKRKGIGEVFRKGNLQKTIGTDKFWNHNRLSPTLALNPGQEIGFMDEHFRIAAEKPVDELVIIVYYIQDDKEEEARVNVPVIQYENRNRYIFPVKGTWLAIGTWDDPVNGHRGAWSQEFALDLIQLDTNLQSAAKKNEESPCYGKEVVAIADGEVIDCYNAFPENPAPDILMKGEQLRECAEKHGFIATGSGNFVILEHAKGESSFYAHFIPGSLQVRKGDKVKQGQVLGKVGNSGNSDGPHLHFQLMDKPSHLTGRGLPCHFVNVKNIFGKEVQLVDMPSSIVHVTGQEKRLENEPESRVR
ncbi:MAG: M23 family metallopeptidase [Candidatus Odinarchaeota archaeon]